MSFAPVFAIGVPLAGLLVLLVAAWLPPIRPYRRFLVPTAAGLSFLGVLFAPLEPARVVLLARWRPSTFFGASPALVAEQGMWPLALALSCAVVAGALVRSSRVAEPRLSLDVAGMGALVAGLAGLWSANLLTALIAWAGFDLAWGLGAAAAGLPARRVVLGAGAGGLATVFLWAGALMVGEQGGLSWSLVDLGGLGGAFLVVAALLRLGLYPLHLTLPAEDRWSLPGSVTLLAGPLLGWGMLARLSIAGGGPVVAVPWVEKGAIATFVGGGLLAWSRTRAGGGWPWVSLAATGGILWAAWQAGEMAAPVLVAGGAIWILSVSLLHLDRGLDQRELWWSVGALVGGMGLLSAPVGLGLNPASPPGVGRVLLFLVGQTLCTAALARRVLRRAVAEEEAGPLYTVARAVGLALPTALLVGMGVRSFFFPTRFSLVGWGAWVLGAGLGGVLFWREGGFRHRLAAVLDLLHDFFRLEWAVRLVLGSLARASDFLNAVADVAEGPGAILWALAIALLVLLATVGR